MKVESAGGIVVLSGRIESDVLGDLERALHAPGHRVTRGATACVRLDSSGVTRVNSLGLLGLRNAFAGLGPLALVHVHMSYALFREFSLVNLLRPQDAIELLQLPLSSARGVREMDFRVGVDIPLLESYRGFTLARELEGEVYELDADAEHLFRPLVERVGTP